MLTSEILDKAADHIERFGWWQGSFIPDDMDETDEFDCEVCVLGAINVAAGARPGEVLEGVRSEAAFVLAKRLGLATDAQRLGLAVTVGDGWNDAAGRTAEQVIAELRAAAASEREAGR